MQDRPRTEQVASNPPENVFGRTVGKAPFLPEKVLQLPETELYHGHMQKKLSALSADWAVLCQLDLDARASFATIGRRVGLSKESAKNASLLSQ